MIRASLAAVTLLAACGDGSDDPCDAIDGACVTVHVESATVAQIDGLALDLLIGDRHATALTSPDRAVDLPVATAVEIEPEPAGVLRIDVVAGGILGGTLVGTGYAATTLTAAEHGELAIVLAAPIACDAGATYCGGIEIPGDPDTVYECTGGMPVAHGRCPGECVLHPTLGNTCAGVGGTCITGGRYCGGDKLDGDPATLYTCNANGTGTVLRVCPLGCVVAPAGDDDDCRS